MKHIKYCMSLSGRSNLLAPSLSLDADAAADPPPARTNEGGARALVRASTPLDRIELLERTDQLTYALQSSAVNQASFRSELTLEGDDAFRQTGKIQFGDSQHELWLSSAGRGVLLPGARPGHRQGAATLRIDGGTGLFKDATGVVTSNFTVTEEGDYTDVHTAVISLGEEQRGGVAPAEQRLKVRDIIDEKAFPVTADASMELVADLLVLTKASTLMVVDRDGNFVGVISEVDLLRATMPDVDAILDVGGTLSDALHLFTTNGRALADRSISRLVKSNPRTVAPDDELLAVATVMLKTDVRRLPVVDRGKFVGSVALADICWAILSKWNGLIQK